MTGGRGERAWWAYAVLWAADAGASLPRLEGVEPKSRVEVVREGELAALVSQVPLDEYGDGPLRRRLEDIGWLERTARVHESVIEGALSVASLLPLRLCTIYRGREALRELMSGRREALTAALARIDGCQEWGVKGFATGDGAPASAGSDLGCSERPGARYLALRRREREAAAQTRESRAAGVREIHDRLSALSRAAVANPPQRRELHGRPQAMVLNGAYLVPRQGDAAFSRAVAELAREHRGAGIELELTGPWPPYNFVAVPQRVAA